MCDLPITFGPAGLFAWSCSQFRQPQNGFAAGAWPQFRGPNCSGIAESDKPPVKFSADTNLLWKTLNVLMHNQIGERIAATPAIAADHIYLCSANHLWAFGR